jgi:hypothetical protein
VAFLAGVRFGFGCGTAGADAFFSNSVVLFIGVSPDRVAVVTIHRSEQEKQQVNS